MILLDSSKFFFPFFSVPSAQPENPIPWISNSIIHQLKRGIFKILHKDVVCTFPLDISFWHAFRVPYVFPSGTRAFLPPVSPGPSDRECSMNGRVYNSAIIQSVTTSSSSINHSFTCRNAINISTSIDRSNRYLSEKKSKRKDLFLSSSVILFLNHMIAHRGQMELSIDGLKREVNRSCGVFEVSIVSMMLACLLACCSSVDQQVARIYVESVLHSVQFWLIETGCWVGQKLVSHKVRSDSIRNYSVGQSDGHPPFRVRVTHSVGS